MTSVERYLGWRKTLKEELREDLSMERAPAAELTSYKCEERFEQLERVLQTFTKESKQWAAVRTVFCETKVPVQRVISLLL